MVRGGSREGDVRQHDNPPIGPSMHGRHARRDKRAHHSNERVRGAAIRHGPLQARRGRPSGERDAPPSTPGGAVQARLYGCPGPWISRHPCARMAEVGDDPSVGLGRAASASGCRPPRVRPVGAVRRPWELSTRVPCMHPYNPQELAARRLRRRCVVELSRCSNPRKRPRSPSTGPRRRLRLPFRPGPSARSVGNRASRSPPSRRAAWGRGPRGRSAA
mmetsp:Transcript_128000/g.250655  ORF Transcript_128000/g.250655 Transcript_128000/m.250655 type:complete len:218 (-) Transcript_128000:1167-1820(-)